MLHPAASKRQQKRSRDSADDMAAAAVFDRAAVSAQLIATARRQRLQALECSKLAAAIVPSAKRSLQQCAAEAQTLVEADAARAKPLLDLHHQLNVS